MIVLETSERLLLYCRDQLTKLRKLRSVTTGYGTGTVPVTPMKIPHQPPHANPKAKANPQQSRRVW